MSLKVKKSGKHVKSQVGFLKPTIASQRRCIGYSGQSLPLPKLKKKSSPKKGPQSSLRSSLSSSFAKQHDNHTEPQSAVQMYASKSRNKKDKLDERKVDSAPFEAPDKNFNDLAEAKKMCEELKGQIDELRLHQESYELRMKSFNSTIPQQYKPSNFGDPYERVLSQDENKQQNSFGTLPFSLPPGNSVIRVNVDKTPKPFQDASNLPEQPSYNHTFYNHETPESVIKKLHSERDKYKRKVLKLQNELKIAKSSKTSLLRSPEICAQDLVFYNADLVGDGRLAVVYEGTLCGKPVAVKKLVRSGVMTSSDRSYLAAEAGLLLPLEHQNIVKVMGVCSTPMEPLIVTEFVNGKSALQLLNKSGGGLDPATFFSVARDTSIGMAYLHSQKPPVLHLNLRPSNVLIDSYLRAKVTDFGFSKIRIDAGVSNSSSLAYLAPELVKFPAQITVKTDVFAFAVLMWQMTTGRDPMARRTTSQILDMMDKNQRLHIHSDLPSPVQKLISSCWDSSPIQRPSFKEIILDFETMALPGDWISKLKEIGIPRVDTTDMASIIQDTTSISSSATSASLHEAVHTSTPTLTQACERSFVTSRHPPPSSSYLLPGNQWSTSSLYPTESKTKWNVANSSLGLRASNLNEDTSWRSRSNRPTPCDGISYFLRKEENAPEIFATDRHMPELHSDEDQSKPHIPAVGQHASDKPPVHPTKKAWQDEIPSQPSTNANKESRSLFDSKFRDFVSDACQAESSSKVNASSCIRWPHLQGDSNKPKNKSLVSSDNIRVRSVSTPSCSTSASASKNSSVDTAVYVPQTDRGPVEETGSEHPSTTLDADIRVAPLHVNEELEKSHSNSVDAELHSDLLKGKAILSNAKRLLSTSPLRRGLSSLQYNPAHHPSSYLPSSYQDVQPLPEYRPCRIFPEHKYSRSEPVHLRSESSSQDGSHESFLPLPPRLQTAHYAFPLPTLSKSTSPEREKVKTRGKLCDIDTSNVAVDSTAVSLALDTSGPSSGRDANSCKDDRMAQILHRTVGELENASDLLYTTSQKLKGRNAGRKSCGSV